MTIRGFTCQSLSLVSCCPCACEWDSLEWDQSDPRIRLPVYSQFCFGILKKNVVSVAEISSSWVWWQEIVFFFFCQLQNNLARWAMWGWTAFLDEIQQVRIPSQFDFQEPYQFSNHKYSDIDDVQKTSSIRLVQSRSNFVLTTYLASSSTDSSFTYQTFWAVFSHFVICYVLFLAIHNNHESFQTSSIRSKAIRKASNSFGRVRKSSEYLWTCSVAFRSLRYIVRSFRNIFGNSGHKQTKILCIWVGKSWQVYHDCEMKI